MKVYWEDDLIYDTKDRHGDKKLIFKKNLEIYRYNEVLRGQKFYNVFARSDNSTLIYSMTNEDKTIEWREIDGINTKEEFIALISIYFSLSKRKRWEPIKYNVPHIMFNYLLKSLAEEGYLPVKKNGKPYFPGVYYNTWHENEELYQALNSAYKAGYLFNRCDPNTIYNNIYIYDFKAFHEALLYYMEFPKRFIKVQADYSLDNLDSYYGEFTISIKKDHPYLRQFGLLYNSTQLILKGWFNDIDIRFIDALVGIERIKTKTLYKVEMDRLPQSMLTALRVCFDWREAEEGIEKDLFKQGYEKFCGEAGRRRFYPTRLNYDEENQTFFTKEGKKNMSYNTYNFKEIDEDRKNHGLDLSWNVWVNSYARRILLTICQNNNGFYVDTDSCFSDHKIEDIYFSEEHRKNCKAGFALGAFELKSVAKDFKCLGFKRYGWIDQDNKTHIKMSRADNDIVKNYVNGDLKRFTDVFPQTVAPYKYVRINNEGFKEYAWRGSASEDYTLTSDKRVIISCAGSGKTTTLIEEVKKRFKQTNEPICVIAFTNKNADELRERIGINSDRLEIRTLDSLAASYLNGAIDGDKFDLKLKSATEILQNGFEAVPVHLYVDEFQDLDLTKFNFINAIPCLSRFYIGDPNQSIYGYSGSINLFDKLDGFKVEKRTINYRCAQNINDYAEGFLGEEYRPHATCLIEQGEINFIEEVPNDGSVIICRTNDQVKEMKERFPERSITTIHKSKGLTYDSVSIVGIDTRKGGEEDNVAYVAATRARNKLNIIVRSEKYGN